MTSYLIDISSHNDIDNWPAVRGNNITGVSVKATQGNYYANPKSAGQVGGARAAGVAPGSYCFGDPDSGVRANVDHFVRNAQRVGTLSNGALLPMLDVEHSEGDNIRWSASSANSFTAEFIRILREQTGVRQVAVYANLFFFKSLLRPDEWADDDVFLWLAVFNGEPGNTAGYNHRRLALHQHTERGIVPGARGLIDRNVTVNGFELQHLIIGGAGAPTPPPAPAPGGGSGGTYVVVSGDTLSGIGAKLGIDWRELARINNISAPYVIRPGQVLATSGAGGGGGASGGTYTVQAGDTLSSIGAKLGIDWRQIAAVNGIQPPYTIYPNRTLTLPGGGGGGGATRTYVVVSGDTLSGIGAKLGIDWRELARINNISAPYVIHPGNQLRY